MNDPVLFTPEEIAQKLKISKYTVYEMIKRGEIPAHHIGRSIRISETQLEQYFMSINSIENVYMGEITSEGTSQYVDVDGIKIYVSTKLEGVVKILIRPQDVILSNVPIESSARNVLRGRVVDITQTMGYSKVLVDVGFMLSAYITEESIKKLGINIDGIVYGIFKAMSVVVRK